MNKEEKQRIINSNARGLLDPMQKLVYNVVRLSSGNTLKHKLEKTKICHRLQQAGHTYLTEPRLRTGGRPDILVMDIKKPVAYEIMVSESDKSINNKEADYHGITLVPVRVI